MDQEYFEDKVVTLKTLTGYQRLREVFSLALLVIAIYLIIALFSFDQADASFSQTALNGPVHNVGGRFGAWLADVLFSAFGVVAYLLPFILLIHCWNVFKQRYLSVELDYFTLALRIIGFLALILSACGLADLSFDDWYNFTSGGILGSLMSYASVPLFGHTGATLILLFIWAVGFTLFTGWSWLTITEKIGITTVDLITFVLDKVRKNKTNRRVEREDDESFVHEKVTTDDVLLASYNDDSSADEQYRVPENQLKLNLDDDGASDTVKSNIEFVAQYPTIETEPTISLHSSEKEEKANDIQISINSDIATSEQEDRISQIIHSMNNQYQNSQSELAQSLTLSEESRLAQTVTIEEKAIEEKPAITQSYIFENTMAESVQTVQTSTPFEPAPVQNIVTPSHHEQNHNTVTVQTPVNQKPTFVPANRKTMPELPRPNPVRIPTRRELVTQGLGLSSAKPQLHHEENTNTAFDDKESEALLHQQFMQQQQARFGNSYQHDYNDEQTDSVAHYELPEAHLTLETQSKLESAIATSMNEPVTIRYEQNQNIGSAQKQFESVSVDELFNQLEKQLLDESRSESVHSAIESLLPPVPVDTIQSQPAQPILEPQNSAVLDITPADEYRVFEPVNVVSPVTTVKQVTPYNELASQQKENPAPSAINESLVHPFLMRNDVPLQKPTTPLPTLDLLTSPPASVEPIDMDELERTARLIEERLSDYRVKANVVGILPGPVVTLYELDLAPGVKAARISNLSRDLARALSAVAVRVVEVIPGRPYVGLELPNKHRQTVYVREVLDCQKFREMASPLATVLGKDISGEPVVADLAKMPHVLVAGTTGSGKSVGVNAMIISMLYKATPDDVRFIMIDPKMLELSVYEGIPHLLTEVVTDMKDAANALRWCVNEMERRYKLMSALGVRNLAGYNERIQQAIDMGRPVPDPFWKPTDSMDLNCPTLEKLPYIVVIVDEFADLMMAVGKKVEELIARLAQKARAAGIHLVLATQRPSVDVITGLIKANIPSRIAFTVSSKIDSRTILDQSGAESLLGMGDMLYLGPNSSTPVRIHGAFVRDEEVHAVAQDWKARGKPQYIDNITSSVEEGEGSSGLDGDEELDPLFDQAVAFVVEKRKPSISGVQRQFRIGYNRAARIVEQMEVQGIVSPPGHNGNREVLAPPPHDM